MFHNLAKMPNLIFSATPFSVQIDAGAQKTRRNTLHHPTEKVPKINGFDPPCGSGRG